MFNQNEIQAGSLFAVLLAAAAQSAGKQDGKHELS